ncbi:putative quinol monooxygenase [Tsukamurella soli]|uniref:Antibiotic biosynthesis monooxygenase n=1 Tax=Tsukamurella soli TaxID=644556 RepID=A0ABP8JQS4_9ACTN
MSVIVTAVFQPTEGRKDELVAALRGAMPAVHGEPGCRKYAIHDASDGTVTMIEKWDSADALGVHSRGEAIGALQAAIVGLVAAPPVVTTMTPLPAGTEEQGEL